MSAELGIPKKEVSESIETLQAVLISEFELYTRTLNFHWNVVSMSFYGLHKMFGKQYGEIAATMDTVAERIRSLEGNPSLNGAKTDVNPIEKAEDMVLSLLDSHEVLITELRGYIEDINQTKDFGTANFLTGIMEQHEKAAWMLRSTRN